MRLYPTFFKLFFASMDPEKAHHIGLWGIQTLKNTGITRALKHYLQPHPDLQTTAMGLTFPSPFGIAAGFDKGGKAIPALAALGFGHIEIGTVTAQAQPGNPQPRLFRLIEDKAVINRMGFNNDGAAAVGPPRRSCPCRPRNRIPRPNPAPHRCQYRQNQNRRTR